MASKQKGLNYFSLTVSWDTNVQVFKARFGLAGIGLLVSIYQMIYNDGYYCRWTEDEQLMFCGKDNNQIEPERLKEMVEYAIDRGIFNKELYEKYQILTSSGIQKRYIEASLKRARIDFYEDYTLANLTVPSWSKLEINVIPGNEITAKYSQKNLSESQTALSDSQSGKKDSEKPFSDTSKRQSKRKESKVKESKVKYINNTVASAPASKDFIDSILDIFCEEYESSRGEPYILVARGKERKAVGSLLSLYKTKYKDSPKTSEETARDFRNMFNGMLQISDKWHYERMSPNHIASNYNELKVLKNGQKNSKNGASTQGVLNSIARAFDLTDSPAAN